MHFSSYSRDELGPSQDKIDVDMIAVVVKNYDSDGYAQDLAKSFGEEGFLISFDSFVGSIQCHLESSTVPLEAPCQRGRPLCPGYVGDA